MNKKLPLREQEPITTEKVSYIKIPVPSLAFKRKYEPLYIILLMIIAFLLGGITTKMTLQQTVVVPQPTTQGAQVPQPSTPPAKVTVANGHFPVLGQDSAKVTIVEFADSRCPFCKSFHDDTLPQLTSDYINTGKVKLYWRQYPFLGPASVTAANALECANDQGHFWDLEDYFYKNQPSESDTSMFTTANLSQIAGTLGMDPNQFQSCLSATSDQKNIDADMADAQKAGVNGTPTFFVNGTPLVGAQPYSAFKTIIDQELAK